MCYQMIELYSSCRCLYYQHAIDRCGSYGSRGHTITQRTLLVGYACLDHTQKVSPSVTIPTARRSTGTRRQLPHQALDEPLFKPSTDSSIHRLNTWYRNEKHDSQTVASRETAKSKIVSDTTPSTDSLRRDIDPPIKCISIPGRGPGDKEEKGRHSGIPNRSEHVALYTRPELDQDDEYDSDGSDQSETKSFISTSSATTVDFDALEIIFNRLLHYQELRFLWPQVVRRSRTHQRSLRNIERFLRRYSEDLEKLAANPESERAFVTIAKEVQIDASRFMRKSRLNLAQRILEAHSQVCEADPLEDTAETGPVRWVYAGGELDENDGSDSFNVVYSVAESFLFETDPIQYLQANVKAFVELPHPKHITETLGDSIKLYFENMVLKLARPPVGEGKKRITWTCVSTSRPHYIITQYP